MLSGIEYINSLKKWAGSKGEYTLDRIEKVSSYLGSPQDSFKSIHVTGSNGKGSVCACLASVLTASGFKVGLTTSPHLINLNERILVNNFSISDEQFNDAANLVIEASHALGIELSQFEAITLCSFIIFRQENVDFAIVEVGLGGRLDATNIISKPDICIITGISLEHQDTLGNSEVEIAIEKAGIIKHGTKCVLGRVSNEVYEVVYNKIRETGSDLYSFDTEYRCSSLFQSTDRAKYSYENLEKNLSLILESSLLGFHQANNIGIAVKACELLDINLKYIAKGISEVYWPCRLEFLIRDGINYLFDCAHNPDGIANLIKYLDEVEIVFDYAVFGALNTKDWKQMLTAISSKVKRWLVVEPLSEQAVSSDQICSFISDHDLGPCKSFGDNYENLAQQLTQIEDGANVLVTGSIYMLGALRSRMKLPIDKNSLNLEQRLNFKMAI